MAIDVTAQIEIDSDAASIAAYAFDPSNDPQWIGGVTEAQLLTPPPVGMGSRVRRRAKFLGKQIDYLMEVIRFVEGRELVMSSVEGESPFLMVVTYRVQPVGTTLMQIRVEGSSERFFGLADFLMAPFVRRNIRKDVRRLKQIIERGR